jgi:alpha-1,2-mannosyltransferase
VWQVKGVPRWLAPSVGVAAGLGSLIFVLTHVRLENHYFDLMVYRSAMRWWADGHPLYEYSQPDPWQDHLGFTYPPVGAFLLRPLAHLDKSASITVYITMAVVCLAASVWWLTRAVARRQGWSRLALFAVAVPVTAGLGAVWIGFDFGQINPLLWALIVFDLAVLAPRRSRFLGIGIGLATAIKLVPGLFIVYLLLSRRVRAAVVAAATAALATLLAHVAAPADSAHYWTKTLWGGEGVGNLWFFTNQSISGVLARIYQPDPYPTWLWLALCLPVAVYGLWRARRAALAGDELTGMALAGFVASLISPVTWVHHIFWWVPALLAITDTAFTPFRRPPPTGWAPRVRRVLRDGLRHPIGLAFVALLTYPIVAVSAAADPGTGWVSVILVNWLVWLMLLLLVTLPIDPDRATADREALERAAETRSAAGKRTLLSVAA